MTQSAQYNNEPHFQKVKGSVHAGIGDQYVIVVDWEKILLAIERQIPSEYINIKRHINALRQIGQCQKKVNELKHVHNLLHLLETALTPFELQIQRAIRQGKVLDIKDIEEDWITSVLPPIRRLMQFAKEMKFLKPALIITENQGPSWILEIMKLQSDFEESWNESSGDNVIHRLSRDLLESCRDYMFNIDKELKNEIDLLDKISYQVLGSIDNDPAKS